jgi:hypothetical protein
VIDIDARLAKDGTLSEFHCYEMWNEKLEVLRREFRQQLIAARVRIDCMHGSFPPVDLGLIHAGIDVPSENRRPRACKR